MTYSRVHRGMGGLLFMVRHWRLSPFSALPNRKEATDGDMPGTSPEWKTLSTERNGLVNISREYGRPLSQPSRALAGLKTTIDAPHTPYPATFVIDRGGTSVSHTQCRTDGRAPTIDVRKALERLPDNPGNIRRE